MANYNAKARRLCGGQHSRCPEKTALLHDLQLDDIGRSHLNNLNKARKISDGFIRHNGNVDCFADLPESLKIISSNWLLHQFEVVRLKHFSKRDRLIHAVTRIRIHPNFKVRVGRSTNRSNTVPVGVDIAAYLDLG